MSTLVSGGPLAPMQMSGQVQQYMQSGQVNGCGIRVVGISDLLTRGAPVYLAVRALSRQCSTPNPLCGNGDGPLAYVTQH